MITPGGDAKFMYMSQQMNRAGSFLANEITFWLRDMRSNVATEGR